MSTGDFGTPTSFNFTSGVTGAVIAFGATGFNITGTLADVYGATMVNLDLTKIDMVNDFGTTGATSNTEINIVKPIPPAFWPIETKTAPIIAYLDGKFSIVQLSVDPTGSLHINNFTQPNWQVQTGMFSASITYSTTS